MPKKCKIKGVIIPNDYKNVYNWFGWDATCPKDIDDFLNEANGEDIEVDINSGGGDVYTGSEIYTLLMSYKGNITGNIVGIAGSAASVIGMGCKNLYIAPTAQIMIHNAASVARGDYRAMQHSAEVLKGWNKSIANAYQLKTNMEPEKLLNLMNKETWLTAQEALANKFVDGILFDDQNRLIASVDNTDMIPQQIIEKIKNSGILQGNLPNKDGYIINSIQKGDDQMNLNDILATLPEDQKKVILDAIEASKITGKTEAEGTFAEERKTLQNEIDSLKNDAHGDSDEILLANVDPKVKAMIDSARQNEAAARADSVKVQAELQTVKEAKEISEFKNIAASFDKLPINAEEFSTIFRNFSKSDKEGFEKLVAMLKASNECVDKGKLFGTVGNKNTDSISAWDQIQNIVKDIMANDKKIKQHDALTQAFKENPELYNQYVIEMQNNEIAADGEES